MGQAAKISGFDKRLVRGRFPQAALISCTANSRSDLSEMRPTHVLLTALLIGGCAGMRGMQLDETYGEARPRNRLTSQASSHDVDYWRDVKPVLESRCVVCHGCYDAPCQLKLTAFEGIDRGTSKAVVYDTGRLLAAEPMRLFEDADSVQEWRQMGFSPVLNEREQTPDANLHAGVMARALTLKRNHPLPGTKTLPESFDLSLNRDQQCPSIEAFDAFEQKYPLWGMPYALPALSDDENRVLMSWIEEGAPYYPPPALGDEYQKRIAQWETFLNGPSNKQQLMSRYIYEHLFLGHVYFDDVEERKYFRLVRSRTAPGIPINLISTRRPYDDPRVERFYYRLQPVRTTIVDKTHMPYAFGEARMARYEELFLSPSYEVAELPGYAPEVAANPFIAFSSIPPSSRYRFMLDEAQFTVMGFIKGPVCRGQIALNVIEDHFWVVFVDPDSIAMNDGAHFVNRQSDNLRLPSSEGSETTALTTWIRYSDLENNYLKAKSTYMKKAFTKPADISLDIVWDGDGRNTNAALTVFRHFDNATVVKGFVGDTPKTAWLIEYPILERIHYLLVAGYDVYGNVGHQLNSRLYMDFLRMEGEFNFLTLLPRDVRVPERDYWYRGASQRVKNYVYGDRISFDVDSGISFASDDPKSELFDLLRRRLGPALDESRDIDLGADAFVTYQLGRLAALQGENINWLPEAGFLTITDMPGGRDAHFSLIRNTGHSNVSHLLTEGKEILPHENTLTVAVGLVGAYPNAFYRVDRKQLPHLVTAISTLEDETDYAAFLDRFGVRRTDPAFWEHSDDLFAGYQRLSPLEAARFDYNRLENR